MKKVNLHLKDIIGLEKDLVEPVVETSKEIEHIMEYSNIPKRYLNAKLETLATSQVDILETFKNAFNGKKLNDMSDVLIYGSVGTGKTYLTIGLLNNMIQKSRYCRYITEHELLELYFQKEFSRFNSFKKIDFLVIDEIGKRDLLSWQMIQLEDLISYRYNEMLPTIFITNLDKDKFKEFVGVRIVDRLKDNNILTCCLNGDSLRGKNKSC